ncbi:lasso peptide biosynthesis B2 protein [Terriglobus roseus]|uniref:Transglutaminase-like superfamily protein n=1 Tax=Terriglobus roseus TaxID=392734 RepID=A0A1H4RP39_9BACT|nr:lasso peptide biosynthesis B2 protein [Terriglobus roseus]SEC33578.1 Transglutaminase-like superfamily protein [Terriglobus roseus]
MRIAYYLRQLFRIPPAKIALLFEATFWLAVARLALWLVPFPRIGRHLGKLLPPSPHTATSSEEEMRTAKRVGWAVNTVADHLPVNLVCLPRALAGWQMLHRRGIASRLHFGALREPSAGEAGLQTHAWLSTPQVEITGYPVAHGCVELGYFARADGNGSSSAAGAAV